MNRVPVTTRFPVVPNTILQGDSLDVLRFFAENTFDAVVTDPPYGLSKSPDMREVLSHWLNGDDYKHRGTGFMGRKWDSFVPGPKIWEQIMRVLKPGGHIFSFSGTRNYDLMVTAMRLAGAEVRDKIDVYCDQSSYMSWTYGCLSEDTEILTENGWKKGVEVKVGEKVMSWDSETEILCLSPVLQKTVAPYQGAMVAFKNDNTDQLLTPNHRVYKKSRIRQMIGGERKSWFEKDWAVQSAGEISRCNSVFVPLAGWHDGEGIGGEDYARLLGWIWTDGRFDNKPSIGVRIYQSFVNQKYVDEIDRLLCRIVPHRIKHESRRTYKGRNYVENSWFFTGDMVQKIRNDLPDCHPSWDLLWRMTEEEKLAFLDSVIKGEGKSRSFYQKDLADLEWFQTLLHMVGMQGCINKRKQSVVLHYNPMTQFQGRHLEYDKVEYDGIVWCVRVETGAFMARRNGKVFITGNSGFPKSLNISKAIDKAANTIRKKDCEVAGYVKSCREALKLSQSEVDKAVFGGAIRCSFLEDCDVSGRNLPTPEEWKKLKKVLKLDGRYDKHIEKRFECRDGRTVDLAQSSAELSKKWEGYGTALKPAHEPIIVFSKGDGVKAPETDDGAPFRYQAKASRKERNKGCDHLFWLDGIPLSEEDFKVLQAENESRKDESGFKPHPIRQGNIWPTIKPLELCRYLVKMVMPPHRGLLLDPFCGSGSTLVAAALEGHDYIGIDFLSSATLIANARTAYAHKHGEEGFKK